MYNELSVSVVVPTFNEEKFIEEVIQTIPNFVDKIIVIDDASNDKTNQLVKELTDKLKDKLIFIQHDVNQGVGAAIITGYKKSIELNIDVACVMAGDGQMDPLELHKLIEPILTDQIDYVKGNRLAGRAAQSSMPYIRVIGNMILSFLTKFSSGYRNISDSQNGYTAVKRECLIGLPLDHIRKDYLFENDILIHLNAYDFKVSDVVIPARYGSEVSKIKMPVFILKAVFTLTTRFFWRIKEKHFSRKKTKFK